MRRRLTAIDLPRSGAVALDYAARRTAQWVSKHFGSRKRDRAGNYISAPRSVSMPSSRSTRTRMGTGSAIRVVDENAQQYGRSSATYNRKRKISSSRLVQSAKESRYLRLQGLTTFGVGPGYVRCDLSSTAPASATVNWPLWLFDLKATNNVEDGTLRSGVVAWRLTTPSTASTSDAIFINNYNTWQNSDGTTGAASVWQPENYSASATGTSGLPHRKIFLDYVQGKFIFYGASARPVRWRVELISLKHEYLHPDFAITADPTSAADVNLLQERNMFWQYMVKPFTTTPINTQNPKYKKYYNVVRTIGDFILEPKLTTEPDLDIGVTAVEVPHMHQLNYFERMNCTCKYDWNDDSLAAWGTNSFQQNVGQTRAQVDFKDRVYLMIRALAPINNTLVGVNAADPNQDPTFDIVLRKKETFLNS